MNLTTTPPLLDVGWIVGIVIPDGIFPTRALVGEVEAVGAHGVRITKVDWLTGEFTSMDSLIPWQSIEYIEVATEQHQPRERFWNDWQDKVLAHLAKAEEAMTTSTNPRPVEGLGSCAYCLYQDVTSNALTMVCGTPTCAFHVEVALKWRGGLVGDNAVVPVRPRAHP